jgi:hypothetical protein
MTLRASLALALLLLAPLATGCAADTDADGTTHANNPHNSNTPSQGIGPSGGAGASPHDMPGGGRGSTGPHGR